MPILDQLKNNKGTVSSALGKELAQKALAGETEILTEAIKLCNYKPDQISAKSVRAGAAKIVEKVSEKNPGMVSPHLIKLLPPLNLPEPQTKWMLMMVFAYCAKENPKIAKKAIPFAEKLIQAKQGLGPACAAEIFLGSLGALSSKNAKEVLPALLNAAKNSLTNEQDWIIEAFIKIFPNLEKYDQKKILSASKKFKNNPKKSTQGRLKKLMKLFEL